MRRPWFPRLPPIRPPAAGGFERFPTAAQEPPQLHESTGEAMHMAPILPAPASLPPICCASLPASSHLRAFPSATPAAIGKLPRFVVRSSTGGDGTRPEPKPGDNESKAVLDAFFLGKAFAEALTERVESVVGEVFSVVGQWQAEQQKQVQEFQEEVVQRAQKAKEGAAMEVVDDKVPKTLREPSTAIVTPEPTSPPSSTTPTQAE